jgi:hypothetical protein
LTVPVATNEKYTNWQSKQKGGSQPYREYTKQVTIPQLRMRTQELKTDNQMN